VVNFLWFDMVVTLLFGLLGYVMKKIDYSRPCFIIAFVLATIVERNLFLSLRLFGSAFILRPIVMVLLIITVACLLINISKLFKEGRMVYSRAG